MALAKKLPTANMTIRSTCAVWLILATCCRVGELMGAQWQHIDFSARTWFLPLTKNERSHTIHLSDFAISQFEVLSSIRARSPDNALCPWVFPNTEGSKAFDIKTFGKQISDRQRIPEKRLRNRSASVDSLCLPGGRWTAHDLRRTASTIMSSLGFGSDVMEECLNGMIASRVARIYIRDRREAEQIVAFDALGRRLSELVAQAKKS